MTVPPAEPAEQPSPTGNGLTWRERTAGTAHRVAQPAQPDKHTGPAGYSHCLRGTKSDLRRVAGNSMLCAMSYVDSGADQTVLLGGIETPIPKWRATHGETQAFNIIKIAKVNF